MAMVELLGLYDFTVMVNLDRNRISIERRRTKQNSPCTVVVTCLQPHTRELWNEHMDVRVWAAKSHCVTD